MAKGPAARAPVRAPGAAADQRRRLRRRARVTVVVWVLAIGVSAAYSIAGLPVGTFLSQQRSLASAQSRVASLEAQNSKLEAKVRQLHSPSYIGHVARADYGLVKPGQRAYAILPSGG
ncbi:MAG: FtsB family cell division protein [Acidimicrobiales bacterium]